ncbi:hypothetical protein BX666DRAFT_1977191 [Dichotomocladium elegans]|nr:hypothetical protein BX666DRAFT_1977191 [Dichotomocladium elegans]
MSKFRWLIPLSLGQILSLCITGTSIASSALWTHYNVSIPYTQNFLNYVLLFLIHGILFFPSQRFPSPEDRDMSNDASYISQLRRGRGWSFFGFSFADVQANILAVLAFKNTSVLSALVVSSWTMPCIMFLSYLYLGYRYRSTHIFGIALSFAGLFMLIWTDKASTDNHSWVGDMICLMSATLYAISNVTEEYLVNRCTTHVFLARAGFWGSILSGTQAFFFEHHTWTSIEWDWHKAGLVAVYVSCLSTMYSLGPTLYRMTNATFLSMSLLTSNFYSLLASVLFLETKIPSLYPVAYVLVISGAILFNISTPSVHPQVNHDERQVLVKDDHEYNYT